MPGLARTLFLGLASSQLLINNVLGQSSVDFGKFPTCAQQYLADAEPAECDLGYNTATDDCLCSNTGGFLTNSAIAIGANCGCAVLTTSAFLLVSICEDYTGGISMDEGQIIAAGWGGSSTCSATTSSSIISTTTQSPPSTSTPSSASSSTAVSSPTTAANPGGTGGSSSGGLDADGKISLVVGIPGAIFAIVEIIGRLKTGSWTWFICRRNKPQRYSTLYQSSVYDRGQY